jgi:hypothetical protein
MKERRQVFMKKNVLTKNFLVLVVITVLLLGLTGCLSITPPATPTTGTVYITITGFWSSGTHDIYMDGFYAGTTSTASYMIPSVTPGLHTFEVGQNVPGSVWDSETIYISAGSNYVTLSPLMVIIVI